MPYFYGYYFDPSYILVLIGVIICLGASAKLNATFSKYSKVMNGRGIRGAEMAQMILREHGMSDISIMPVGGNLTDHFDPRRLTISLSEPVFNSTSIAAVAVASHECGHALQRKNNYFPYNLRHALVPVARVGSGISWILIIAGLFMGSRIGMEASQTIVRIGIICFSAAVLFQVVTLPVEFNASNRAVKIIASSGLFTQEEVDASRKVLRAAALTYVASAASAILQLLRLFLIFGRRSD